MSAMFVINNIGVDAYFHAKMRAQFFCLFNKSRCIGNGDNDFTGQNGRSQALCLHAEQTLIPQIACHIAGRFFNAADSVP